MTYIVIGLLFEAVGFAFLAFEIRRTYDFARFKPLVYGFADLLKREQKKLGDDIFRPQVRGADFEENLFNEVVQYFDLPLRISDGRKGEIIHLGWLLLRDYICGDEEWRHSIEKSLVLAEGKLLSKRVVDWSHGVLLFAFGAAMQIYGTISS